MLIFHKNCEFLTVQRDKRCFDTDDGGNNSAAVEYAFDAGCLITKHENENGIGFEFPVASECIFEVDKALTEIENYCADNYIPLVFTFVDGEKLSRLKKRYCRYDINPCDGALSDGLYVFRPLSEIFGCDSFPSVRSDGFVLSLLSECDAEAYDRLCRDDAVNKFWGYDYRVDCPFPAPDFFLNDAKRDLKNGLSLSLAIKCDGELAGEAVLHGFNCRGSANAGIRLFEKYQGYGIGGKAFSALTEYAFSLGLSEIRAKCFKQNTSSFKMLSRIMTFLSEDEEYDYFIIRRNN